MRRLGNSKAFVLLAAILVVFILMPSVTADGTENQEKEKIVVATASNLGYFAQSIAGEKLDIQTIIPPGVCPGHYSVSPGDVKEIAGADLILWNGFESWLKDTMKNSGNTEAILNKGPSGPWGPPPNAKKYVENITKALNSAFPEHSEYFKRRRDELISEIDSCAENIEATWNNEDVQNTKVISINVQKGFVEWLGFDVVKVFPSPEQLSTSQASKITSMAENEEVSMIISNFASGQDFGDQVSSDTGIEHVVLLNFPGSKKTETYTDVISYNSDALFEGLKAYRSRQERVDTLRDNLNETELERNVLLMALVFMVTIAVVEALIIKRR